MLKPSSKKIAYAILTAVIVFFAIDLTAGMVLSNQWAFEAAEKVCSQHGWKPGDFSAADLKISGGFVDKIATLEYQPRDQVRCKTVRIVFQKSINLSPWTLTEYTEVPAQP
jgi:hypothetical protein